MRTLLNGYVVLILAALLFGCLGGGSDRRVSEAAIESRNAAIKTRLSQALEGTDLAKLVLGFEPNESLLYIEVTEDAARFMRRDRLTAQKFGRTMVEAFQGVSGQQVVTVYVRSGGIDIMEAGFGLRGHYQEVK